MKGENGRKRRVEKEKKGWRVEAKEGGLSERKFFPRIGLWMLRASMQVLIKRIQKRRASSFVWRCGRGSLGGLTPPTSVPCGALALLSCQAALVYLNIGRSRRVKVRKRIERHSTHFPPLFTSPPWIHVSPNPQCCLWQGKWSTLFIHLLDPQTKASHCESWG